MSLEELKNSYKNIRHNLKIKNFQVEPVGIIESEKMDYLSESFEEDEIFRVNFSQEKSQSFKTTAPMSRISIKYLSNIDKIIPSINQNFNLEQINNYNLLFPNEKHYVRINNGKEKATLPYNKVYLNSQYSTMEEFISKFPKQNKQQKKGKPKIR